MRHLKNGLVFKNINNAFSTSLSKFVSDDIELDDIAFRDFNKLNTFLILGVGGVPQRAVLPNFPLYTVHYYLHCSLINMRHAGEEGQILPLPDFLDSLK